MRPLLFGVAGALVGALSGTLSGAALGFAVGYLFQRINELRSHHESLTRRYLKLEERQETLQRELAAFGRTSCAFAPRGSGETSPEPKADAASPAFTPPSFSAASPEPEPALPTAATSGFEAAMAGPEAALDSVAVALRSVTAFFTAGNVVAKAGVIIVFFGVAFLLRYAAERGLLPIEFRLMGTAGAALLLLVIGWWLRHTRRDYALVLQGGAVGVLYLTIFAAFRLYSLLPGALTFGLLLAVVAFSCVLAIVQDARSMAVLGTSGGFLAPILASTGGGDHVALFTYFAVLNVGVLGIAWFRAWRFLNWLAFVFTFGIGLAWGQQYYAPPLFASTEPFLILFFLMFVAVAVLYGHRQPPRLRGYIDGTLVFGAPAIAFSMQSVLVRDIPFGRAYSAVAVSALYLALTRALWRRDAALRPLAEAFLAIAIVFLVLAVPMAFDGHATAVAWALEGAALVWVGIRQQRQLARAAGAALLVGAAWAFAALATAPANIPILNTQFLGGAAIAIGSVISGLMLSRAQRILARWERPFEWVLLVWGLLWWFGTMLAEIATHGPDDTEVSLTLIGIALSGCAVSALARRWQWRAMTLAAIPVAPLLWFLTLVLLVADEIPFAEFGWLAWPIVIAVTYLVLFWSEDIWPPTALHVWHAGAVWHVVFLASRALADGVERLVPESQTWPATIWCIVPATCVLALPAIVRALPWPAVRFAPLYLRVVPIAPAAGVLLWVLWASTQRGSSAPLPYVPLLNPLELAQMFGVIAVFAWWKRTTFDRTLEWIGFTFQVLIAVLAFVALNLAVARGVHFYAGVPFTPVDLMGSFVFHAGISILWGVMAGTLMTVGRRRLDRQVWMLGAGLLAALILKLFIIDLSNAGGIARIVSFLATGVLILVIGYFAPAPPKPERTT